MYNMKLREHLISTEKLKKSTRIQRENATR